MASGPRGVPLTAPLRGRCATLDAPAVGPCGAAALPTADASPQPAGAVSAWEIGAPLRGAACPRGPPPLHSGDGATGHPTRPGGRVGTATARALWRGAARHRSGQLLRISRLPTLSASFFEQARSPNCGLVVSSRALPHKIVKPAHSYSCSPPCAPSAQPGRPRVPGGLTVSRARNCGHAWPLSEWESTRALKPWTRTSWPAA